MGVITGWHVLVVLVVAALIAGVIYIARKGVPKRSVRRAAHRDEE
ncbi:hypothetical protein [Arthrobacter gallicola]|nr:hypothetical protein [Arthrobacter gallicola]